MKEKDKKTKKVAKKPTKKLPKFDESLLRALASNYVKLQENTTQEISALRSFTKTLDNTVLQNMQQFDSLDSTVLNLKEFHQEQKEENGKIRTELTNLLASFEEFKDGYFKDMAETTTKEGGLSADLFMVEQRVESLQEDHNKAIDGLCSVDMGLGDLLKQITKKEKEVDSKLELLKRSIANENKLSKGCNKALIFFNVLILVAYIASNLHRLQ